MLFLVILITQMVDVQMPFLFKNQNGIFYTQFSKSKSIYFSAQWFIKYYYVVGVFIMHAFQILQFIS